MEATINQIAKQTLGIRTLETRKSDSLDFHELAVWSLKEALNLAYQAGKAEKKDARLIVEAPEMLLLLKQLRVNFLHYLCDEQCVWGRRRFPN
jgi:hypothetical protein